MLVCEACIQKYNLHQYIPGENDNDFQANNSNIFDDETTEEGGYWFIFFEWYDNIDRIACSRYRHNNAVLPLIHIIINDCDVSA